MASSVSSAATACKCSLLVRPAVLPATGLPSPAVLPSLPALRRRRAAVGAARCAAASEGGSAAILAAAAVMSSRRAVGEPMSTTGHGTSGRLGLGVSSSSLLGWVLVGVFALAWSLYVACTSTLIDEDNDSALSL